MDFAALLADPPVAQLLACLNGDGEETRIVGGAVRNHLLGMPVADIDLATTALPDDVIVRARHAALKIVPVGLAHGTVSLVVAGRLFEVTTLRRDIATDGRRAKVQFGRDFAVDAARRDFTINAMSVDMAGKLHDTQGGLADLEAGRVRFIGDPDRRIREDYLRILRFFRFHAYYGRGAPDAAGVAACLRQRFGLSGLSRERLRAEILRLMLAAEAAPTLAIMSEIGIIGVVTGGIAFPQRLAAMLALAPPGDALLRLAAAFVCVPEDAARLYDRLRLARREADRLARAAAVLVRLKALHAPASREHLCALLYEFGRAGALDGLALHEAGLGTGPQIGARHFLLATTPPQLPVSGADVMSQTLLRGPAVGRVLKRFQAAWIRAGFPEDPAAVARILQQALSAGE
ncbi:MAG: CCA tRNA nucleotidyltransferase [Hyphomicrobiales bacterium]|nr:CCA tRNA nucleotidyltransferase [Hyphomicrobiales bacterium]